MGKKQKSKARLDKYYYLAKEHGFRSRAAFKLIQLNKKYHFLESATCLIDLCAAPGGWLQVAAKYMPVSSIKIGVDLDNIKPIHGVTTFQADITSEKCRFLIRKEIKHFRADVVLNDGAPNVGGNWSKDAYNQSELVLFALKLATEFLKEGGWFITKIFRSSDYNSLLYVLKQLFSKVEATKPQASRNESAEIFVVCQGYKAPSYIDNKLLDPKYALKQLEDEEDMKMNTIKSIKAMFEQKRNRSGYSNKLYNERSFKEFVECSNPYQFLTEVNKIKANTDESAKYLNVMKCPIDYKLYFEDIQILGKKEVQELIIWRNKIRSKIFKTVKEEKEDQEEEKEEEVNYEEKKMEEINTELAMIEKQKKKKLEHEKKKKEKNEMRMKMSFINEQENMNDNNDVEFDENFFQFLKKENINIEDLEYRDIEKSGKLKIPQQTVEEINLSDISEDEYLEMMNEDIEENIRLYHEKKSQGKKKEKNIKKKKYVKEEEEVEEKKNNDGILYIKNDEKDEDDDFGDYPEADEAVNNDKDDIEDNIKDDVEDADSDVDMDDNKQYNSDKDSIDDYLSDDEEIENPLRKKKNTKLSSTTNVSASAKGDDKSLLNSTMNEEENLSSDTDEEDNKKLTGKKTKRSNINNNSNNINDNTNKKELLDSDDEEYDSDEVAEIRAIAKKMLRKKDRLDILYKTYNRYAFSDLKQAPDWFASEEQQHNKPHKPVTKEEIMAEKEILKKFNDRMPKKILEAKARKKNKLAKRMEKVKKKAQVIVNQDEINEVSKIKQIEKLYKKELRNNKEKKKYMVSRSFKVNKGKNSRNIKHVDRRLKKDKRAQKARDKKKRR
jgi:AdoMet-dependent rRNA methyltransferase SPB1